MTSLELLAECQRRGYLSKEAAADVLRTREMLVKKAMKGAARDLFSALRKAKPPKKPGFMDKMRIGALTKNEGDRGWTDVAANLAKMMALAGMTAGATAGIGGLIRHSQDRKLKGEIDTSYQEIFKEYPVLKEFPRDVVQRHFGVLARYAPSMAADPTVAGSWVQSTAGMGQVNPADIKNLAETQRRIDEARDRGRGGPSPIKAGEFAAKAMNIGR